MSNIDYQRLIGHIRQLKLSGLIDRLDEALKLAIEHKTSYQDFLEGLFSDEVQRREEKALERSFKQACFPSMKTLDSYDFNFQPGLDKQLILNLSNLNFIERNEVVIFIGPPGVGKTHLSIALGSAACNAGYRVLFLSSSQLIRQLRATRADDSLDTLLRKWGRIDLLILDEMGYLNLRKEDAALLFQLVSRRYEKGSLIITTNINFDQWDGWLGDAVIASAILDRLLHHSTVVPINGESFRIRNRNYMDKKMVEKT